MQFVERTPIEAGFAEIYDRQVRPMLPALERQRRRRNILGWFWFAIILLIGGGIAVTAVLLFDWDAVGPVGAFFVGIMVLMTVIFATVARQGVARGWKRVAARQALPVVAQFLDGLRYDPDVEQGFPLEDFNRFDLISDQAEVRASDRMSGLWRGRAFDLVSVETWRRKTRGNNRSAAFRGLAMQVWGIRPAPTRIRIGLNPGKVLNRVSKAFSDLSGMHPVRTGHTGFDRQFAIYAADPEAARRWLTPALLSDLAALGQSQMARTGESLRAAFEDDMVCLVLRRQRRFMEMSRLGRPIGTLEPELHAVFDDLQMIRNILDRLPR